MMGDLEVSGFPSDNDYIIYVLGFQKGPRSTVLESF